MRPPWILALSLLAACDKGGDPGDADGSGSGCSTEDADGDGLDGCAEEALGTDPALADSDEDGFSDGDEADCVSDPLDASQVCYSCGWAHSDPGTLGAVGPDVGDTIENLGVYDQCGEEVKLWDFAQAYHILFMTAEW